MYVVLPYLSFEVISARISHLNRAYCKIHCVSKNDTDVAQYNFNTRQPILLIFGRDVAERVCYRMMFVIPPLLITVSALPGETLKCKNCIFSLTCSISALPDFDRRWLNLFNVVTHSTCCYCCVAS